MRISQRLFLAVVPGIVGLLAVAGLAYWREYSQQPPEVFVVIAFLATLASLGIAWHNARYVTRRVERLAGAAAASDPRAGAGNPIPESDAPDELQRIENTVQTLSGAVMRVRNEAQRKEEAATTRASEYASLIASVTTLMTERLEDAELPLHVLLSSPFGSLNENQEELISAAQSAIGAAGDEMRRLQKLIDLDQHIVAVMRQRVNITELLRPALAIAGAHARRAHIAFDAHVPDTTPRVMVDPVHTQEAMTTVLDWAVGNAESDNSVSVDVHEDNAAEVRISVSHGLTDIARRNSLAMLLAVRLINLQNGRVVHEPRSVDVYLPCEELASTRTTAP